MGEIKTTDLFIFDHVFSNSSTAIPSVKILPKE